MKVLTHIARWRRQREFWAAAGVVLGAGALYFLRLPSASSLTMPTLGFVPIAFLAVISVRQVCAGRRLWTLGLGLVALMAWRGPRAQQELVWLVFAEYMGFFALLALEFGVSLVRGREPLCTHFARLVRSKLTPGQVRYTRQVTVAWTAFFVGMMGLSAVLFATTASRTWAVFADLVTPVLVAVLFVAEYLVRCRVLPREERLDLGSAIRGYRAALAERGGPPATASASGKVPR